MVRFSTTFVLLSLLVLGIAACSTGANQAEIRKREVATRDLGRQYFMAGDYTAALNNLLKAEKLDPDDYILQNYLGQTYFMKDKPDLAIRHFKEAIKLNPEYAVAKNNLGVVYLSLEQWDNAIVIFKEMEGDLLYATPHYPISNLGYAYYQKGEYETAEKYYLKALDLEPGHLRSLRGLGRTYLAMGRLSEAVAALEKATEQQPKMAEAHFDLAQAYERMGNRQRAIAAYRQVINLAPQKQLAWQAQEALNRLQ